MYNFKATMKCTYYHDLTDMPHNSHDMTGSFKSEVEALLWAVNMAAGSELIDQVTMGECGNEYTFTDEHGREIGFVFISKQDL